MEPIDESQEDLARHVKRPEPSQVYEDLDDPIVDAGRHFKGRHNHIHAHVMSDGATVHFGIADRGGTNWHIKARTRGGLTVELDDLEGFCLTAYGKAGSEMSTIRRALGWIAKQLMKASKEST